MVSERLNIYQNQNALEKERARLERAYISPANKAAIREYQDYQLANDVGIWRTARISMALRNLAESLAEDFATATKEDIQRLVATINQEGDLSPVTKADKRQILKQFYKFLKGRGEEFPEEVKWISVAVKQKDRKRFEQLVQPHEVKRVVYACEDTRDKAFIAFLYESGARIGEVLNMRIRDFQMQQQYAKVRLDGKTGERWIVVVWSAPLIMRLLEKHPFKDNAEAHLWLSQGSYRPKEPLMYIGAKKILKRAFLNAGIQKPCNPHRLRHSRATELAKDLNEVKMCLYLGWEFGSKQVRTYVHASGKMVDETILRLNGIVADGPQEPKTCYRCGESNAGANFCKNCGYALTTEVAIHTDGQVREETNKTFQLLLEISQNPELLKGFEEFRKNHL